MGYRGLNHPKSCGAHPLLVTEYGTKSSNMGLEDVLKVVE